MGGTAPPTEEGLRAAEATHRPRRGVAYERALVRVGCARERIARRGIAPVAENDGRVSRERSAARALERAALGKREPRRFVESEQLFEADARPRLERSKGALSGRGQRRPRRGAPV